MSCWKFLLMILLAAVPAVCATEHRAGANPIRRVVKMLQMMQKKVTEESEMSEKLFDKFMCYCKNNLGGLAKAVEGSSERIPALESSVKANKGKKVQLEKDLATHQADRKAAQEAMAEATGIRTKEKASVDTEHAESSANFAALSKAIDALSKGLGSGFLQTNSAAAVRSFLKAKEEISETDREDVLSFLSGKEDSDAAPQTMEIMGILKQSKDDLGKEIAEMEAGEKESASNYDELIVAKKKQVSVLSKSIELKLQRVADVSVEIATMKNELEDSKNSLAQDQAFVMDLNKNCKNKKSIHEKEKETRSQETVALADTIKILNDDDALDLFKKTLPSASASFMQMQVTASAMRAEARALIKKEMAKRRPSARARLAFISQALRGKKVGIEKIVTFIGKLVATLESEQMDDDDKKEFCAKQLDDTEDKKKSIERSLSDMGTVIDEAEETTERLVGEIKALKDGIVDLDMSVAEANSMRKTENEEFKELMQSNGAAKELLLLAKTRMNQFYNQKLALQQKSARAAEKGGDEDAESFLQLAAKAKTTARRGAPPPPPETAAAYTKQSAEGGGCIAMMNILISDLDKEMTVAKSDEEDAQEEYERMVQDSASKRAEDSKSLTDKEGNKAAMEATVDVNQASKKSTTQELMGTDQYLNVLHGECDWLMQYFDVRKEARADEVDSLNKAKAVLSGADYSFVQLSASVRARKFLSRA